MDGIKYEDLPVVWKKETKPNWSEAEEAVIEEIAEEVGTNV